MLNLVYALTFTEQKQLEPSVFEKISIVNHIPIIIDNDWKRDF